MSVLMIMIIIIIAIMVILPPIANSSFVVATLKSNLLS